MKSAGRNSTIGIVSAAFKVPPGSKSVKDVFAEEGLVLDPATAAEIGIDAVHVFEGKTRSALALEAAKECLLRANLRADTIDAVVDFSVLPQDYVVPSWCMSNRIQHEIGARNAFNLGFGGGGTTNLLVALGFVVSLIDSEEIDTALLIASDVAIPENRVINRDAPLTVLGDGASALVVGRGPGFCEILDIGLWSDAVRQRVLCVSGGGLAHPESLDLYRLRIDTDCYSDGAIRKTLKGIVQRTAEKAGVNVDDARIFINPNISAGDRRRFAEMFRQSKDDPFLANRRQYGHIQGTDIVINIDGLREKRTEGCRELAIVCSHGWGFSYGVMIARI